MKRKFKMNSQTRDAFAAICFLLPNFIGFLVFTSLPIIASMVLSFFKWDFITTPEFVGLTNYSELIGFAYSEGHFIANSPDFWYFLGNTFVLMLVIPFNIAASMFLAMLLNEKLRGLVIYRTVFFLPSITAGIAIFVLWRWIYSPEFGLMNSFLQHYLLPCWNAVVKPFWPELICEYGPEWLNSTAWSKPALMIMSFWISAGGYNMILYLAALQGISPELYEAAQIDGAGLWNKFYHITLPMLKPTTFFIVTMSIISGLQSGFQQAYIMTGGGPAGSTTTIGYYIYQNAYLWQYLGKAAAVAWLLFLLVFMFTIINWKYRGKDAT